MPTIENYEARVNITYAGENGDLPDPVSFDAGDSDVKTWVAEAVESGTVPGIPAQTVDLSDFVVDRFAANEGREFNYIVVRPKTPFGA